MHDIEKIEASGSKHESHINNTLELKMYDKVIKRRGFLSRCEERVMFERIIEIQNTIIHELITHKTMFDYFIRIISEALYKEDLMYLVHFNVDEMGEMSVDEIIENYTDYFEICESCTTPQELIDILAAVKLSDELFDMMITNTPSDIATQVNMSDKLEIIFTYRGNICEHNYALAIHQCSKISRKSNTMAFIDLVQEAMIGLNKAVEKFNPYLRTKFSTVATSWIYAEVLRSIDNSYGLISIPCNILGKYYKTVEEVNALTAKGETPSEEQLKLIHDVKFTYLGINQTPSTDSRKGTFDFSEILADNCYVNSLSNIVTKEMCVNIKDVVNSLPEKEKLVIISLFGLNETEHKMSISEIMESLRIKSYEYNKIKMNAFRLLKETFETNKQFNNWNLILENH